MTKQELLRELDAMKDSLNEARKEIINERYVNARVLVGFDMQEKVDELFEMLHEAIEAKAQEKKNPTP